MLRAWVDSGAELERQHHFGLAVDVPNALVSGITELTFLMISHHSECLLGVNQVPLERKIHHDRNWDANRIAVPNAGERRN